MKKKKSLKLLIALGALLLIVLLISSTNIFSASPFKSATIRKQVKEYVEKTYPNLDLELDKPMHNLDDDSYLFRAYSQSSKDTTFNILYKDEEIRDDYEEMVETKLTTILRLQKEYGAYLKELVGKELDLGALHFWVSYNQGNYGALADKLELDMDFDKYLAIRAELNMQIAEDCDFSIEGLAWILESLHSIFLSDGCVFHKYDATIVGSSKSYEILGVKPDHIEAGELLKVLYGARESSTSEYDGLYLFERDKKED